MANPFADNPNIGLNLRKYERKRYPCNKCERTVDIRPLAGTMPCPNVECDGQIFDDESPLPGAQP